MGGRRVRRAERGGDLRHRQCRVDPAGWWPRVLGRVRGGGGARDRRGGRRRRRTARRGEHHVPNRGQCSGHAAGRRE